MSTSMSRYDWRPVKYVDVSSPLGDFWPNITFCPKVVVFVSVERPLWQEDVSVICYSQPVVIYQYLHQGFTFHVFYSSAVVQSFFQSWLATADYALLVAVSSNHHSSLRHLNGRTRGHRQV
jgi:hypothetical protein